MKVSAFEFDKMNVLVTGSTGFIGKALVSELLMSGAKVSCLLRKESASTPREATDITLQGGSLQDFKVALRNRKFDFVIHLASYGVKRGDDNLEQIIQGNINYLCNLLNSLDCRPRLVINTGTCAEYGFIKDGEFVTEEASIKPVTLYAAAKSAATLFGEALARQLDIKFISLRLFGVYGEGEAGYRLLPYIVASLKQNKSLELTTGQQQRDVLYIDDVVSAYLQAIKKHEVLPAYQSYNVCSGAPVRVRDFVEYVAMCMQKNADLLQWGKIERPDEPTWLVGDNSLFRRYTSWEPVFDMKSGLDKSLQQMLA